MDQRSIDYFCLRERIEREAAAHAASDEARSVHEELARGYAALIRGESVSPGIRLVAE